MNRSKVIRLAIICVVLLSLATAAAQDASPVSGAGSYKVGTQIMDLTDASREDRTLQAFVWYPALVTKDAPRPYPPDDNGAPYPLIIYSHGFSGTPTEATSIIERLVSQGFVVAGVDHKDLQNPNVAIVNRPLDVLFLLNQLAALPADNPLAGLIDTDNVGVTGFSMGAYTTMVIGGARVDPTIFRDWCEQHPDVKPDFYCPSASDWAKTVAYHDQIVPASDDELWASLSDERIKAIMPLAPCSGQSFGEAGLAPVSIPVFIVSATDDESCPYDLDASYFFAHLGSADRSLVTLDKRTHLMVIRELPVIMTYETAFFGLHLQDKTDYAQYLTPETASAFRKVTLDVHTEDS